MPSCVLRYCRNHSGKTNKCDGITFHKIPRTGHSKREAWIKFVQKNRSEQTWLPSDHTVICSAHFKDEHKITTKSGLIRLKNTAVPCEDPITPAEKDDEEPLSEEVSSSESIFDTPSEIDLKQKLRKESAAKKKLAEKFKKLQKQYNALKKKFKLYKKIVQTKLEK